MFEVKKGRKSVSSELSSSGGIIAARRVEFLSRFGIHELPGLPVFRVVRREVLNCAVIHGNEHNPEKQRQYVVCCPRNRQESKKR